MNKPFYIAILIPSSLNTKSFINAIKKGKYESFLPSFDQLKIAVHSKSEAEKFVDLEERLDIKTINTTSQSLKSMSSGEQLKLLLNYLLKSSTDLLVLDNPFDSLDIETQASLIPVFSKAAQKTSIIQLATRSNDILPFIDQFYTYDNINFNAFNSLEELKLSQKEIAIQIMDKKLPLPKQTIDFSGNELVSFKKVSVSFYEKPVLQNITWQINKGEFWQLIGPNGSGKSTLIGMITGDNPKGYNTDLHLFGRKKGSGETIWSIKEKIGYFSPSQVYNFKGGHSVLNMIISGFNDSVGLYSKPSEIDIKLANEWLQFIGLWDLREKNYRDLTIGQQRIVMCARAMVKHPPLLILDEPTVGLDDASAQIFVNLVNRFFALGNTSILYVSHRNEHDLKPTHKFELTKSNNGSIGMPLNLPVFF